MSSPKQMMGYLPLIPLLAPIHIHNINTEVVFQLHPRMRGRRLVNKHNGSNIIVLGRVGIRLFL